MLNKKNQLNNQIGQKIAITFLLIIQLYLPVKSQNSDTLINDRISIHYQSTVITQIKPGFNVKYTGDNSLLPQKEVQTSMTSTIYLGLRLWKGASIFFNPEIAGGSGLSEALGIASATNGETFRIGNPAPVIYLARLFYKQVFSLSKNTSYQQSDFNQLGEYLPDKYLAITIGKIGAADYFDDNKFSHDPRTQFMSWGLMSNGAWDYPANTRGYTPSVVIEYVTPKNEMRFGLSLLPILANGNTMNWDLSKASSSTLEYTHRHKINNRNGAIRLLGFFATTNMGNYKQSVELDPINPSILKTRKFGNTKYGFTFNAEQDLNNYLGCFLRAGWNDGNNETWAFTEIDHTLSAGLSLTGEKWKRSNDNIGFAYVVSGISKTHREYLKAGGKGFMLGDGSLNYSLESLFELFYKTELLKDHIFLTGTYQFLINPGYNADRRGPVNVFSIRLHTRI